MVMASVIGQKLPKATAAASWPMRCRLLPLDSFAKLPSIQFHRGHRVLKLSLSLASLGYPLQFRLFHIQILSSCSLTASVIGQRP
jgi:hypothetical protein